MINTIQRRERRNVNANYFSDNSCMRAYGVVRGLGLNHKNIRIDSLTFKDFVGNEFIIDFATSKYNTINSDISFSLKSLGATFSDSWIQLSRDDSITLESDFQYFRTSQLIGLEISAELSIPDDLLNIQASTYLSEFCMFVGGGRIDMDLANVNILIWNNL
jgi:hypothetical protein